ncbi:hypothetical protein J6590_080145 [Homalodisca vitripennis]|nr:hypothetical protein J6590_080145 [Homalodisca vitripennis]
MMNMEETKTGREEEWAESPHEDFHGTCVKINRADLDYLTSEGTVWRCNPCSVTRRASLRLDSKANEGNLSLQDVITSISELSTAHKQSVIEFNKSYEVLNDKLDENTKLLKEQSEQVKEYFEIIECQRKENKALKEKVEMLESRMDEAEQYSRRNTIEIQGVPHDIKDVLSTVKNVGKALGMEITDSMVDICHSCQTPINSPTRIADHSETCIDHVLAKISNINEVLINAAIIEGNITDHCMTAVWLWRGEGVTADSVAVKVASLAYRSNYIKLDSLPNETDWCDVYLQTNASHAFDVFL